MKCERTYTNALWEKKVGYCRAIRVGDFIYVTGTAPVDDAGGVYAIGDPYRQAQRCVDIIEKSLSELGAELRHVVRTRMFVTDISLWEAIGRAHGERFREFPPATTMVEVKSLIHPDMLIEIEADAICPRQQGQTA